MMSGHEGYQFSFIYKIQIGRPEHLLPPPPPTSDNISSPLHFPYNSRHMRVSPKRMFLIHLR